MLKPIGIKKNINNLLLVIYKNYIFGLFTGIDVDSLIRGDPEVFMPMMRTAAKAFDMSTEKLKCLIPLSLAGSLPNNSQVSEWDIQGLS
jgi:hypothetical protein